MPELFDGRGGSPAGIGRSVRVPRVASPSSVAHGRFERLASSGKAVVSLLFLSLALTACAGGGGGGAQSAGSSADYASREASPAAGGAAGGGGSAASAGAVSPSAQEIRGDSGDGAELPGFDGERIVKTAELGVRADDVRESASGAQEIAARFGGSVSSSRVDGGDGEASAELVLSVPSPEFEAALEELRALGEVTTDTVDGEDVTEEFVDLESRERNLLAAEESLLRLYDEAESVDDALSIERELTALGERIELVQGRLQYLEDRTDKSRISLTIRPVEKLTEAPPAWEPAEDASRAWNASLAFLGTVAGGLVSVVVFGWWLAPALVATAIWWRRRPGRSGPAGGT